VKIFPQKNFALKVGLGREELQGYNVLAKNVRICFFSRLLATTPFSGGAPGDSTFWRKMCGFGFFLAKILAQYLIF